MASDTSEPERAVGINLDARRVVESGDGPSTVETRERRMKLNPRSWIKYLAAILLGQALYFALAPHLPLAARHQRFQFDLGTVIDFWFCLFVYGLIELVVFLRNRAR